MTTVLDSTSTASLCNGTFDDAQAIVKSMFKDAAANDKFQLAAINSINWARILAQIVYYFYAYLQVVPRRGAGAGRRASAASRYPRATSATSSPGSRQEDGSFPVDGAHKPASLRTCLVGTLSAKRGPPRKRHS